MRPMTRYTVTGTVASFTAITGTTVFCHCIVFCGHQLLVSYLRPSNIDGAKQQLGDFVVVGQKTAASVAKGADHLPR